ncbi:hypothetical protein [Nocardia africana]|uniref:Transposase for insertion sequence element IS21-like C-terminal domain-containing protein n=1 Tax=Nocardia africana TaxID=134964 RepID=A0ABW6NT98_9NOCA
MLAKVIAGVRRARPNGKSEAWETVAAQNEQIKAWLDQGLTLTKIHVLLGRRGVVVSYRTLHRYATTELRFGNKRVPGDLIGQRLTARVDAATVKLYFRGELIKVHARVEASRRQTDPADLPSDLTAYAMRDLNSLGRKAFVHGPHVGAYAAAVLEHPLPWTKMRQVYRLLGLVARHGEHAVTTPAAARWTPKSSMSDSSTAC